MKGLGPALGFFCNAVTILRGQVGR